MRNLDLGSRCLALCSVALGVAFYAACGSSSSTDTPGADGSSPTGDASLGGEGSTGDATAGCGTCPTGYTCGAANGLAVCRSAVGTPLFKNVFVILMENTSLSSLDAAKNTPYLADLKKTAASGSDYHGAGGVHPSLPNYIALTSGDDQGIKCDCGPVGAACAVCTTFAAVPSGCGCNKNVTHLGDQLESGGKTWKAYAESMGTACNYLAASPFAARHVPFLYYDNMGVGDAGTRCQTHVVDYGEFAADLASPPEFSFIAPNLEHDMHGTGLGQGTGDIAAGDTWLSTNAKAIIDSAAFKSGGLLVIVWDEDDNSGLGGADDPIPIFVISPYAKSAGYVSSVKGDHFALLATIEEGMGLPRLGKSAMAMPLVDYFPAN